MFLISFAGCGNIEININGDNNNVKLNQNQGGIASDTKVDIQQPSEAQTTQKESDIIQEETYSDKEVSSEEEENLEEKDTEEDSNNKAKKEKLIDEKTAKLIKVILAVSLIVFVIILIAECIKYDNDIRIYGEDTALSNLVLKYIYQDIVIIIILFIIFLFICFS